MKHKKEMRVIDWHRREVEAEKRFLRQWESYFYAWGAFSIIVCASLVSLLCFLLFGYQGVTK